MLYRFRKKFHQLPIELKITIPLLAFQILLLTSLFLLADYLHETQRNINIYTERVKRANSLTSYLGTLHEQISTNLLSYRFTRNPANIEIINRNEREITETVEELADIMVTPEEQDMLDRYLLASNGLEERRDDLISAINNNDFDQIDESFTAWNTRSRSVEAALEDLTAYKIGTLESNSDYYDDFIIKVYTFLFFVTTASIATVLLLFYYLQKVITRPIAKLSMVTDEISKGNFGVDFDIRSEDEIGRLAANLSEMTAELEEYYEHLKEEVMIKEKELEKKDEIDKRKNEFISIASHELKTPLTSVKGYVQVLEKALKKGDIKKAEEYLRKADLYVDRLNRLISDLLDISRIEAGRMKFNITYFPLKELLDSAVETVRHMSQSHRIRVNNKYKGRIKGDFERLEQVLTNLLSNAIKYSPEAKEVIVSTKREKDNIVISITDFGIGIPKKKQNKLFTRFYRVENISSKISGLGIGLYISAEIVRRHNGEIWVESQKGKGSTFYVSLPIKGGVEE